MLTQCPECKTTFRLHVNQLKAAAGKVRCSRCHTTFDALDNLVEAPLPVEEPSPAAPPEEKTPTNRDEAASVVESTPSKEITATTPGEAKESPSEPGIETIEDAAEEDTLSAFIEELEQSTTGSDETPLPLVGSSAASSIAPADHHEYSIGNIDEALSHEPPHDIPSQPTNLITTALDFIDDMPRMEPATEESLLVVKAAEQDEVPDETFEELFTVEPVAAEPAELDETPDDTFEEFFAVEPVAAEPARLDETPDDTLEEFFTVEPVAEEPTELDEAEDETIEELFTVEPVAEEPTELDEVEDEAVEEILTVEPVAAEPSELDETPDDTFEEFFAVEPVATDPSELDETPDDTLEEFFAVEPAADEPAELDEVEDEAVEEILTVETVATEPAELDEAENETIEELFTVEPVAAEPAKLDETPDDTLDDLFTIEPAAEEPAGPDEAVDELSAKETVEIAMTTEEPLVSDEELDALFDEVEPDTDTAATETVFDTAAIESEPEATISDADLDAFFDEPVIASSSEAPAAEQDELLSIFDEVPDDGLEAGPDEESAIDEVTLPEEPPAPATPGDPLIPFSEEQLESMLSPSEEQVAEEAAVSKVSLYAPEELDLDTGDVGPEELTAEEQHRPADEQDTILTDYTVPTDYVIPSELTSTAKGSGSGIATLLWGLGILLMCATLVLQYLYYHRLQLVENPQLRPVLATLCDLTGCTLPPRRDLGRIELTEHLVQFHPNYEQSLLISATLANRADFAQPYPLVEVVMTDIEQRVVAHRRFTPEQYLPNHQSGGSFPANSEVPLLLEVLDPGNDAVGFEFRFY